MSNELLFQLVMALVTGGAVYGGIRADLKSIGQRIQDNAAVSARAHDRIDKLLERGRCP